MSLKLRLLPILAVLPFVLPLPVHADENEGTVLLQPTNISVSAKPGDTIEESIRLSNSTAVPIEVHVSHEAIVEPLQAHRDVVTEWTTVSPQTLSLDPNDFADVTVTIQLPADAEVGPYFVKLRTSLMPINPEDTSTIIVLPEQLTSQISLRVQGKLVEMLELDSLHVPLIATPGSSLSLTLHNAGTNSVSPRATVHLNNTWDDSLYPVTVPEITIQPDQTEVVSIPMPRKLWWGRYNAQLEIVYGLSHAQLTGTTSFFVLPLTELATIIIITLVLGGGLSYWIHHRMRVKRALWDLTHN